MKDLQKTTLSRRSLLKGAAATVELASPGVSTVDYASLPYQHLRRPIWPMDEEMTWEAPGS